MKDATVTFVPGFQAGALQAGIRASKDDTAIIYCPTGAVWAGAFTRNLVKAAPVKYNQALLSTQETVKIIYTNSGNANACTGKQGMDDTRTIAAAVAEQFACQPEEVLMNATGVIGVPLPMDIIMPAIKKLPSILADEGGIAASEAILTTDTTTKNATRLFKIDGKDVHIGAMCKGSGMIHPNMGTMLCYITTDINISKKMLQQALNDAVDASFNHLTVDGDTSTNDTALVMANGLANNQKIETNDDNNYKLFSSELRSLCQDLAKQIAADGEGATKFVTVKVDHAYNDSDAKQIAMAVATSNLVKTAMNGNDANWGRIIAAIGYAGVANIDETTVSIAFESKQGFLPVLDTGEVIPFNNDEAIALLMQDEIVIHIDMGLAQGHCQVWTCDFSQDYVKINADYRS